MRLIEPQAAAAVHCQHARCRHPVTRAHLQNGLWVEVVHQPEQHLGTFEGYDARVFQMPAHSDHHSLAQQVDFLKGIVRIALTQHIQNKPERKR